MLLPLAADLNAFHVVGIAFTAWAVIVGGLGMKLEDFPRSRGLERAVVVISALLFLGTITAAVATSEKHGAHESTHGDRENPTSHGESPENAPNE